VREIDAAKAWETLSRLLGVHLADAVKVGIGAAEAGAVANALAQAEGDKVNKAAIKRDLMKALDEAGAIIKSERIEYRITKKKEAIEHGKAA
jgi:hypothetical protein